MKFLLVFLALTVVASHALPQYTYDPAIKKQGYDYPPPEVSFDEPLPPSQQYEANYIPPRKPNSPPPKSAGYVYPVPSKKFPPAPSNSLPTMRTHTSYPTTAGYIYTHPPVPFTTSSNRGPSVPLNQLSAISRPTVPFKAPSKSTSSPVNLSTPHTTSPTKSSGYSYLPPSVSFSLPTKLKVKLPPPQSSQPLKLKEAPTKATPSAHNTNGYSYKPPDVPFIVSSKTLSTNSKPPKKFGYSYTPPHTPFNPTTSPKAASVVSQSPTDPTKTSGYLYNAPRVPLSLPQRSKVGYTYTPPAIPFTAPERTPKVTSLPKLEPAVTQSPTESTKTAKLNGYLYPKPEVPLTFPTRTPETEKPLSKVGYTYTPPAIPFTTPERTSKVTNLP
ncbi:PREDICTED: extensin-2-like isoform X2 [Rhagoletis zephyria]|uniref:extensin-2-like isoform X2 n=1 Tax=Rhagoletis zephyria TaxID=28612 RepID=UPI000811A1F6|nr:PREDICTED: extensin-2-like isoform X2 [Rhagoletis zephyria]